MDCKADKWQEAMRKEIALASAGIQTMQNAAGAHTTSVSIKYLDGMNLATATA